MPFLTDYTKLISIFFGISIYQIPKQVPTNMYIEREKKNSNTSWPKSIDLNFIKYCLKENFIRKVKNWTSPIPSIYAYEL